LSVLLPLHLSDPIEVATTTSAEFASLVSETVESGIRDQLLAAARQGSAAVRDAFDRLLEHAVEKSAVNTEGVE
jgi:hypothetical protein